MDNMIRSLPKAELHIHIEGSLEPEMMFALAERNGVRLPYRSVEEARAAYAFSDLQSFLDLYYEGARVLMEEADFFDLTAAYLKRAHSDGVRHAEIFFDPQTHTDRGVPFAAVVSGIHAAQAAAAEESGISSKLIMCFLRDLSVDSALQTLQQALPYREWIVAVGLDSAEVGHPPEKFAAVFEAALKKGFLSVAHAGEEGPPEYIRQALDLLHVSRIDHGVRCLEDPELVDRLRAERVPLTVCPLSNVKLRVFKTLAEHNLKRLLDAGLCVTVNSDDPAYFGGYVAENLRAIRKTLHLTEDDIRALARNSFEASFLSEEEKQRYVDEIERFEGSRDCGSR